MTYPEYYQQKYENAEASGTWTSLIADAYLMLRWQIHHPEDLQRIATVAGHKTGRHTYCIDVDGCKTVDLFLRKKLIENIHHALAIGVRAKSQQLLFG